MAQRGILALLRASSWRLRGALVQHFARQAGRGALSLRSECYPGTPNRIVRGVGLAVFHSPCAQSQRAGFGVYVSVVVVVVDVVARSSLSLQTFGYVPRLIGPLHVPVLLASQWPAPCSGGPRVGGFVVLLVFYLGEFRLIEVAAAQVWEDGPLARVRCFRRILQSTTRLRMGTRSYESSLDIEDRWKRGRMNWRLGSKRCKRKVAVSLNAGYLAMLRRGSRRAWPRCCFQSQARARGDEHRDAELQRDLGGRRSGTKPSAHAGAGTPETMAGRATRWIPRIACRSLALERVGSGSLACLSGHTHAAMLQASRRPNKDAPADVPA